MVTWSPTLTCHLTMSASVRPSPTSGSLNSLRSDIEGLSVAEGAVDSIQDPVQVREVMLLQPGWRIRGGVRADAQNRSLEAVEAFLRDLRRDLGADATCHHGLVHDDAPARLADGGEDRLGIQRSQRAQVDDLDGLAITRRRYRGLRAGPHHRSVAQHGDVSSGDEYPPGLHPQRSGQAALDVDVGLVPVPALRLKEHD